ncbi:hypothetical protein CBL_00423 [Carabus blaptoides fortunei]
MSAGQSSDWGPMLKTSVDDDWWPGADVARRQIFVRFCLSIQKWKLRPPRNPERSVWQIGTRCTDYYCGFRLVCRRKHSAQIIHVDNRKHAATSLPWVPTAKLRERLNKSFWNGKATATAINDDKNGFMIRQRSPSILRVVSTRKRN